MFKNTFNNLVPGNQPRSERSDKRRKGNGSWQPVPRQGGTQLI